MNKTLNENDAAFLNDPSGKDDGRYIGDFSYDLKPMRDAGVGLTEQTIDYIVDVKGEPEWLREFRKNAFQVFNSKPLPTHWAGDESRLGSYPKTA